MAPIDEPSHLLNPLVTSIQLETSATRLDGVSHALEQAVHFETARLTQAAGILLRLPQDIIAHAIVVLLRYWAGPEGGSLLDHDSKHAAAAALYLTAKPSAHPVTPRQVLSVVEFLSSAPPGPINATMTNDGTSNIEWQLSESQYQATKIQLYEIEAHILRVVGYQTHVALPHALCVNYLQTLDVFHSEDGALVARKAFEYLNSALLSPQVLYLTHQPSSLATAAIYLAARHCRVKLPETEWWEVFDVDREELGFLVVAFQSVDGFASAQQQKWHRRKVPMTVEALQSEVERSQMLGEDG